MAGVILSDSLPAAKAVAECRMLNRRRGDASLPAGRRRRTVVSSLHRSWAAVLVALDSDASLSVAGSRLLVSSTADATSRRPGCRALVSSGRRIVVSPVGRFGPAPGILLLSSRVEELLNSLRHHAALFALEVL